MRSFIKTFILIVVFVGSGYVLVKYWSYIFARNVTGVITDVQKVSPSTVVVGGGAVSPTAREMFSYAVAIKEESGEIATASTEDRQWAVAQPGQCASAKFYPYPPWDFEKSGTFFGARLLKLHVCGEGGLVKGALPTEPTTATPSAPVDATAQPATTAPGNGAAPGAPATGSASGPQGGAATGTADSPAPATTTQPAPPVATPAAPPATPAAPSTGP